MAISFEMSNYRSDFMLSDAAMPKRVEAQINKEQTNGFAQLLKDMGGTSAQPAAEKAPDQPIISDTVNVERSMQPMSGLDEYGLPKDDMELARWILKGKGELEDVPAERVTIELLKALIIVAKTEKLDETEDEEDSGEEEDFFVQNGEEASKSIEALTLLDQLLAVLYKFIAAYNEEREGSGDKVIGAIKAQMGLPSMLLPIAYALGEATRMPGSEDLCSFLAHNTLTFEEPDSKRFPGITLAEIALKTGGSAACTINAANEVAVAAFLHDRIGFNQIVDTILETLPKVSFIENPVYEDFVAANEEARAAASQIIEKFSFNH